MSSQGTSLIPRPASGPLASVVFHLRDVPARHGRGVLWWQQFYSLPALLHTPCRRRQTLWTSRVLIDGRWGEDPRFTPVTGLYSHFFWTDVRNLYRHGESPPLAYGRYQFSGFFSYSLPSLFASWGAATLLVGMHGCGLRLAQGLAAGQD